MYKLFVSSFLPYYQFFRLLNFSMNKYHLLVYPAFALLMISCSGNKIDEAGPVAPTVRPAPPAPQPQDGSFIVRPDGTSKIKLSRNVQLQASAAAEREVIRRQQAAQDAESEVEGALQDLKEGSLDEARVKLRKAVQKYPKIGT